MKCDEMEYEKANRDRFAMPIDQESITGLCRDNPLLADRMCPPLLKPL